MMFIKRIILYLIFLFPILLIAQINNINITGENNATYIYKTAKDSLNSYFQDELNMTINKGHFTFGMTFLAQLPKYDKFSAIKELEPNQLSTKWTNRYVQVEYPDFLLKAGNIEETFGVGIVLSSMYDAELERDKRLEGVKVAYQTDFINISGIYGSLVDSVAVQNINKGDLIIGSDMSLNITDTIEFGASAVQYKNKNIVTENDFNHNDIFGGRFKLNYDLFDFNSEYVEYVRYHNVKTSNGSAIYGRANIYTEPFIFSTGYKQYKRFYYPISELPSLNHYDELLSSITPVSLEEGIMGEITYNPDYIDSEILLHYAESWNDDYSVRHSNAYISYKHDLSDNFKLKLEFEQIERIKKNESAWEKDMIPSLSFEMNDFFVPIEIKLSNKYSIERHYEKEKNIHRPHLQCDTKLNENLSISIAGEYEISKYENNTNDSFSLAGEIVSKISNHTDIKLFLGKENGGKVCRNGVCQHQAPFEGVKLSLITRF